MTVAVQIAPVGVERLEKGLDPKLAPVFQAIAGGQRPSASDLAEIVRPNGRRASRAHIAYLVGQLRDHVAPHGWFVVCDKTTYRYHLDRVPPKPVLPLRIKKGFGGNQQCFAIFDANDVQVSGAIAGIVVAEAKLEAMTAEARRRVRPCLSCEKPFQSDGNHNRMCPTCRGADDGDWFGCRVIA